MNKGYTEIEMARKSSITTGHYSIISIREPNSINAMAVCSHSGMCSKYNS